MHTGDLSEIMPIHVRIRGAGFCDVCLQSCTDIEITERNTRLVRLINGDPEGEYAYVHPGCVKAMFEKGIVSLKENTDAD